MSKECICNVGFVLLLKDVLVILLKEKYKYTEL